MSAGLHVCTDVYVKQETQNPMVGQDMVHLEPHEPYTLPASTIGSVVSGATGAAK